MTKKIKKDTALVIVDVQNDYFEGGKYPLHKPKKAVEAAKQILDMFRAQKRPIFHVQHISNEGGAGFFLPNTAGVQIHRLLQPQADEQIIEKHAANSFYKTTLNQDLKRKGISTVVICGMMSHHCIDSTVRACAELGYETHVVKDACATTSLKTKEATIDAVTVHNVFMAALQGFANVVDSAYYTKGKD